MRKVICICAIFLTFLLESRITVFGVAPDLAAALAYYFGLKNNEAKGMMFGSFIGLIGDTISGGIIGPNILGKGLVGFFSAFISGGFFKWTPLLGIIGLFFLTFLDGIIVFSTRTAFEYMPASITSGISIIFISSVVNSLFGAFMRPQNEN